MTLQLLVPVHTYPDENATTLAAHAVAVARHLKTDVHALALIAEFPRVGHPLGTLLVNVSAMVGDVKADCRRRAAAPLQALEAGLDPHGLSFRKSEAECLPEMFGREVAHHARYHDLVVIAIGASDLAPSTAEATIFGSGRPVLLMPENPAAPGFDHIAIAWDGSRVAARAVADARPFLARARQITIASVGGEKKLPEDDPGRRLADYLARNGMQANAVRLESGGRSVAQVLQEHAGAVGADMLVMGGFGHSRARDFVLGGATNGVMRDLRLPALISH